VKRLVKRLVRGLAKEPRNQRRKNELSGERRLCRRQRLTAWLSFEVLLGSVRVSSGGGEAKKKDWVSRTVRVAAAALRTGQ